MDFSSTDELKHDRNIAVLNSKFPEILDEFNIFSDVMRPENLRGKRILISPLNWGMGHVARCIGMIHQLREQGNEIFIACDEVQKSVFCEYFDDVTFISHAGYPFYFGGKGNFGWDLLRRSNSLRRRLKLEREEVRLIVSEHKIDVLISDHRYGFISDEIPSFFMTHQVNLPVKWYEKSVGLLHKRLMKKFKFIWVLDDKNSTFAGKLSKNCPENGVYIGPYSRFSIYSDEVEKRIDLVLIASGPEIYAEELIREVLKGDSNVSELTVIHSTSMQLPEGVKQFSGSWKEKDQLIRSAGKIISRSGYSTLMDCKVLNIEGVFIPTKGQAEQVYLAELWSKRQ